MRKKYHETSSIRVTCGFGFVGKSNQYKVLRIYQRRLFIFPIGTYESECEIYTLGTGMWRSLEYVPLEVYRLPLEGITRQTVIFFSGNLHWLASDVEDRANQVVWTFNLERELFQPSSATPRLGGNGTYTRTLGIFEGCLCLCDKTSDRIITIWVMKDYGMKECWSKKIVIVLDESNIPDDRLLWNYKMVRVLKVLKDGTILMLLLHFQNFLFTYHPGNKTLKKLEIFGVRPFGTLNAIVYTPSLISLKSFGWEKVSVF